MNSIQYFIKIEMKLMGINFYIPLLIYVGGLLYSITNSTKAISMIELVIVPLSCWWTIWLFYDYLCLGGRKLLTTYPAFHWKYMLRKLRFFLIVYVVMIISLIVSIVEPQHYINLLLQFIPQVFFFSAISLFCMAIFRNVELVVSAIVFFIISQVMGIGEILMVYNPFFFNDDILPIVQVISKSIKNLFYGFLLYWISIFILEK